MVKSTIKWPFSIVMFNYQRVSWGIQNGWFINLILENPHGNWMRTGGNPISGNHQIWPKGTNWKLQVKLPTYGQAGGNVEQDQHALKGRKVAKRRQGNLYKKCTRMWREAYVEVERDGETQSLNRPSVHQFALPSMHHNNSPLFYRLPTLKISATAFCGSHW